MMNDIPNLEANVPNHLTSQQKTPITRQKKRKRNESNTQKSKNIDRDVFIHPNKYNFIHQNQPKMQNDAQKYNQLNEISKKAKCAYSANQKYINPNNSIHLPTIPTQFVQTKTEKSPQTPIRTLGSTQDYNYKRIEVKPHSFVSFGDNYNEGNLRIIDNSDNNEFLSGCAYIVDMSEPLQTEPFKLPTTSMSQFNLLSQLNDFICQSNTNHNVSSPSTNSMDTLSTNSSLISSNSFLNSVGSLSSDQNIFLQDLLNQHKSNIPTLGQMQGQHQKAKQLCVCKFEWCKDSVFGNEAALKEHYFQYHDVGLEFRLIALATFSHQRKFPRIGLQCPYVNCDALRFYETPNDVFNHLKREHNEDLMELKLTQPAKGCGISTMDEAAYFCMKIGEIPKQFNDKLIYCCPFAKNDVCTKECHVSDAEGLLKHFESFHALHRNDGQLIINVLRFMELKPIWRDWSDEKYRNMMHKRLEALLKYRGNVRKGFVKEYKAAYTKKYAKLNGKKPCFEIYRGMIKNENLRSILNDSNLFWNNWHLDQEIFEQVMAKNIARKYNPKKAEKSKKGRKRTCDQYAHDVSKVQPNKKRRM